jgi:hypothetical protein
MLWGFPGESPDDYARMAAIVPFLTHLPAPQGFAGLRLDRFSPNFVRAGEMGFVDVQPLAAYRHIYGFSDEGVSNIAYSFTYRYRDGRDVEPYVKPLLRTLRQWRRVKPGSDLLSVRLDDRLLIWDFRPVAREALTVLTGVDRDLYQACDQIADMTRLSAVAESASHPMTSDEIGDRLRPLVERGLILKDGGRHLALAIPVGEYLPSSATLDRMNDTIRRQGLPKAVVNAYLRPRIEKRVSRRSA